jgi:hypothetical protein
MADKFTVTSEELDRITRILRLLDDDRNELSTSTAPSQKTHDKRKNGADSLWSEIDLVRAKDKD